MNRTASEVWNKNDIEHGVFFLRWCLRKKFTRIFFFAIIIFSKDIFRANGEAYRNIGFINASLLGMIPWGSTLHNTDDKSKCWWRTTVKNDIVDIAHIKAISNERSRLSTQTQIARFIGCTVKEKSEEQTWMGFFFGIFDRSRAMLKCNHIIDGQMGKIWTILIIGRQ